MYRKLILLCTIFQTKPLIFG